MCIEGYELLLLLEAFTNERAFEAQLPNNEKDVVEELEPNKSTETTFCSRADAAASVSQCRVILFAYADCCAEYVEKGVDGLFTQIPEYLAGFPGS